MDRIGQQHQKLFVYRFLVRGTVEQRLYEVANEEKEKALAEGDTELGMSDDMVRKLLARPANNFNPASEEDGMDPDELWWLTLVRGGHLSRRDYLERFMATADEEEGVLLFHGVEVPRGAVKLIEALDK